MLEELGNIWTAHDDGHPIVIPTNGIVTKAGLLVMGRGLALQAVKKWPRLAAVLADRIEDAGNHVFWLPEYNLFSFPVKEHWKDRADLQLIIRSAGELVLLTRSVFPRKQTTVYLPRVGCGNGKLRWSYVKPALSKVLSSSEFVVMTRPEDAAQKGHFDPD